MTLAVAGALRPNKPNLDMTMAVAGALRPNKPNLDMTMAVEVLNSINQSQNRSLTSQPSLDLSRKPWFSVGHKGVLRMRCVDMLRDKLWLVNSVHISMFRTSVMDGH